MKKVKVRNAWDEACDAGACEDALAKIPKNKTAQQVWKTLSADHMLWWTFRTASSRQKVRKALLAPIAAVYDLVKRHKKSLPETAKLHRLLIRHLTGKMSLVALERETYETDDPASDPDFSGVDVIRSIIWFRIEGPDSAEQDVLFSTLYEFAAVLREARRMCKNLRRLILKLYPEPPIVKH